MCVRVHVYMCACVRVRMCCRVCVCVCASVCVRAENVNAHENLLLNSIRIYINNVPCPHLNLTN